MINWYIIRKEYYNKIRDTNKPQLLTFNIYENIYKQSDKNTIIRISTLILDNGELIDMEPIIDVKVIDKFHNEETKKYELWLKKIN